MNELKIFENPEFGKVRVVKQDGEPWFVANDVCDVFGESNRNRAMQALEEDEKGYTQIETPGGLQRAAIVNEAGLYSMLFAMQPTKARGVSEEYIEERETKLKNFKRWVTHDVLPSIRKHGAYMTPETIEAVLMNPDTIIRLATELKAEREKVQKLEVQAEEDRPKVLFAQAVESSDNSILVGDLAKILRGNGVQIGQNRLFQQLREQGYLIKRSGSDWNMPTQRSMELGILEITERAIANPDGSVRLTRTPKVTGKGQTYFVNLFLGGKRLPLAE